MDEKNCIVAKINYPFEVNIESMYGSTHFKWAITKLPESVFLISTELIPTSLGISPVIQRFVFAFNGQVNTNRAQIEFTMIDILTPSFVGEDSKKITVDVVVKNLDNVASSGSHFVEYSENSASVTNGANSTPLYKYAHPNCFDATMPAYKYAHPSCVGETVPAYKYAHPSCVGETVPAYKYAHPSCVGEAVATYMYAHPSCVGEFVPAYKYAHPSCIG